MLIKSIKIENLFGMFNYDLTFNYDKKITILYGPNGIGKTVILNLIDNIFQKENTGHCICNTYHHPKYCFL